MNKTIYSKEHKFLAEQLKKARIEAGLDQIKTAEILGKIFIFILIRLQI